MVIKFFCNSICFQFMFMLSNVSQTHNRQHVPCFCRNKGVLRSMAVSHKFISIELYFSQMVCIRINCTFNQRLCMYLLVFPLWQHCGNREPSTQLKMNVKKRWPCKTTKTDIVNGLGSVAANNCCKVNGGCFQTLLVFQYIQSHVLPM